MSSVNVKKLDEVTYEVTVQAGTTTTHSVTVQPEYATRLTAGAVSVERLVSRSFDFLLQREPNTSILRSFDLTVIGRYFPEYERTIRTMLG